MGGSINADELERHLITLVDDDLRRLPHIGAHLPAPVLLVRLRDYIPSARG